MTAELTPENEVAAAQFRALANTIPNLAWMARPDGWIFWYNRRWYEYTGATPEEMAGWGWQSVHDPEVLPVMLDRWTHTLSSGEAFEMIFPLRGKDGVYRPFLTRVEPLRENDRVVGWYGTNTDITEQELQRQRLQILVNELNHRVKNMLATIQSIAAQSLRDLKPDSSDTFQKRLMALAKVHDLLTGHSWVEAPLEELLQSAIAHCGSENFDISGPAVNLTPRLASAMGMTIHELCTNAVKHGCLSRHGGRVQITWSVEPGEHAPELSFAWLERGGPAVTPPVRRGFGTRLIERAIAAEAGAKVDLSFASRGVECELRVPLKDEVVS